LKEFKEQKGAKTVEFERKLGICSVCQPIGKEQK
jgi:hypothetical protein